jgi:endoglucanase
MVRMSAAVAMIVLSGCASGTINPTQDPSAEQRPMQEQSPLTLGPRVIAPRMPAREEPEANDTGDTGTDLPSDAFAGYDLYVAPGGNAARTAASWRSSDPAAADLMDGVAAQPLGMWIGDWNSDVTGTVDGAIAEAGGKLRVLVVYDIPNRDCGAWSAGGAADAASYAGFITKVAAGIAGRKVIVVLEPDALPLTRCLTEAQKVDRFAMLSGAVDVLTAAGASVYLDAGDSNWIGASEIAAALVAAGVGRAAGFSLNVSHTELETNEIAFAQEIRAILGIDAHFVIDTSRSGLGPADDNEWCNPPGRALGSLPTLITGIDGLDGLLWIKPPGESDGSCNGGPPAGQFWPDYALGLAERAR